MANGQEKLKLPSYETLLAEAIKSMLLDSGTVTTLAPRGTNILQDNTKIWAPNIHSNRLVKIIGGTGTGQTAVIGSNTANSLVLRSSWAVALNTTSVYVILEKDLIQILRDVFGGGSDISVANPLEVHDPKVGSLISYEGTTTANGAGDGSTLICAALTTLPDYNGNQVIITSGACIGQARDIDGVTTGGIIAPHIAFGAQIVAGVTFVIAAIRTTPAEVAALTALVNALMADVGDASASTLGSLLNILGDPAQDFLTMIGYEGATSLADKLTAARAALIDNLDAAVSSRAAPADPMDLLAATITAIRQSVTDVGDPANSIGKALYELYVNRLTATRADYLDRIKNLTRPQAGTQATTNVLATVGAAITEAVPFKVSGYLSLHNMQAGDTFLVVEEIRDQNDVTYREYGRNSYSDVQTSPMVWFEEKVCQGWRVRIQRTGGADRDVTYQFFLERASTAPPV